MDSSELKSGLNDLKLRLIDIREGVFDVTSKENRLKKIEDDLAKVRHKCRSSDISSMSLY